MAKVEALIRSTEKGDYNFIINSWLKSFRKGSYFAKRIRDDTFYKYHHQICSWILARESVKVLVACDPESPNVIWGYLIYDHHEGKPLVHYTYVKAMFRQMGIAKDLAMSAQIDPNTCILTHWTYPVDALIHKFPEMIYCPYLI